MQRVKQPALYTQYNGVDCFFSFIHVRFLIESNVLMKTTTTTTAKMSSTSTIAWVGFVFNTANTFGGGAAAAVAVVVVVVVNVVCIRHSIAHLTALVLNL